MRLKSLLVVDPVEGTAQYIAAQCERLAHGRLIATSGDRALAIAGTERPELVALSAEVQRPEADDVARELRRLLPQTLIIVTFRELTVPAMERLAKLGVDDFVSQPIDFAALFRAASRHFGLPFRRHDRHSIGIDLMRLDGVVIGRTRDLSEGGMLFDASYPLNADESLLVDLALPTEAPLRLRCHILSVEPKGPGQVQARAEFINVRGGEHKRLIDFLSHLATPADAA